MSPSGRESPNATWSLGGLRPDGPLREPPCLPGGGPTLAPESTPSPPYADDLFDELVALPAAHREAVLAQRCGPDTSLIREVRALLSAHDDAESQISDDQQTADPDRLEPGQRLGPWYLAERLGQGATASVWKAFDTQLESWSALKVVHARRSRSPHALDAVMNEARAASRIISDHVVRVRRAGRVDLPEDREVHYIEMELCAEHRARPDGGEELVVGHTLANESAEDHADAARLVMEAARGVDAAHRIGVLHRDIKPANVLVTPVSRRALVADFGLSTPQLYPPPEASTPSTATVTVLRPNRDGVLVGTPSFMAPEQAFGHPQTRTSDVYGLGATLYALLAGAPPYTARPGAPIPALDVVGQVQQGPPTALRAVAPSVPRRLVRIVDRAMARSHRHRYPTAAALADDLQSYLEDRPTSNDGLDPLLRTRLFVRRNRAVASATAVMSAALFVFAVAVWRLEHLRQDIEAEMRAAQDHRDEAEQQAADAEARARTAELDRLRALAVSEEARAARDEAEQDRQVARSVAEHEIEQRLAAEEEKLRMQRALAGETDLRTQMKTMLDSALFQIDQERRNAETLQTMLRLAIEARERVEHERDVTQQALEDADQAIAECHATLAQRTAQAEAAQEAAAVAPDPPLESTTDDAVTPLP